MVPSTAAADSDLDNVRVVVAECRVGARDISLGGSCQVAARAPSVGCFWQAAITVWQGRRNLIKPRSGWSGGSRNGDREMGRRRNCGMLRLPLSVLLLQFVKLKLQRKSPTSWHAAAAAVPRGYPN